MSINIRSLEKLQNVKFNPIKYDRMPKNTTNGIGQKSHYSISYILNVQTFFEICFQTIEDANDQEEEFHRGYPGSQPRNASECNLF